MKKMLRVLNNHERIELYSVSSPEDIEVSIRYIFSKYENIEIWAKDEELLNFFLNFDFSVEKFKKLLEYLEKFNTSNLHFAIQEILNLYSINLISEDSVNELYFSLMIISNYIKESENTELEAYFNQIKESIDEALNEAASMKDLWRVFIVNKDNNKPNLLELK